MNVGFLLMSVAKNLKYELNKELLKEDITAQQYSVLQNIERLSASQPVTSIEIATLLDMDKPTMSGVIKRLEEKKFIERKLNPLDKRSSLLVLTSEGKGKLSNCLLISNNVLETYLFIFSKEERDALELLLTKLNERKE